MFELTVRKVRISVNLSFSLARIYVGFFFRKSIGWHGRHYYILAHLLPFVGLVLSFHLNEDLENLNNVRRLRL